MGGGWWKDLVMSLFARRRCSHRPRRETEQENGNRHGRKWKRVAWCLEPEKANYAPVEDVSERESDEKGKRVRRKCRKEKKEGVHVGWNAAMCCLSSQPAALNETLWFNS